MSNVNGYSLLEYTDLVYLSVGCMYSGFEHLYSIFRYAYSFSEYWAWEGFSPQDWYSTCLRHLSGNPRKVACTT